MSKAAMLFSGASLAPVLLISAAAVWGDGWVLAALVYMTLVAFGLDEAIAMTGPAPGEEFPSYNALSVALALGCFLVLGLSVWALAGGSGLGVAERAGLFMAAGLFLGQVGNANAHELIHRQKRGLFRLGRWVYISLLFGHHASAHRLVHHRHVATWRDPNSARQGEGFYRFFLRAWAGSFRDGYHAETALRDASGRKGLHPYAIYFAGAAGCLAVAWALGGSSGILAYLALAGWAQSQLLLSDYVQHYGLRRVRLPGRRFEPVGPRHSWNAPHWFTSRMMLNAPRHSDHHAHPAKPYPELYLPGADEAPTLPRSLPAMATLALFPTLWRRVMDPRAAAWRPEPVAETRTAA